MKNSGTCDQMWDCHATNVTRKLALMEYVISHLGILNTIPSNVNDICSFIKMFIPL